jgi:hypothetical protein
VQRVGRDRRKAHVRHLEFRSGIYWLLPRVTRGKCGRCGSPRAHQPQKEWGRAARRHSDRKSMENATVM